MLTSAMHAGSETLSPRSTRVLIVDPHADAACSLAMLLRARGHQVQLRPDLDEAVQACRDFEPHAVLVDPSAPAWRLDDVVRLARSVLAQVHPAPPCLVAVCTTLSTAAWQRLAGAGFLHALYKPVSGDALQDLLVTLR